LDGDWYDSIKVCLDTLYDKVVIGGVIILDDYGHWVGNKKATDEFREKHNICSPLIQTDNSEYYWIKTDEKTGLCSLAEKYYVDKCPCFVNHTYTPHYNKLLVDRRKDIRLFLEIGIGNVPLMAPLTSQNYKPGGSLRMWRDYCPNAQIVGCDILDSVLFNDERITTFQTDQSNVESLNQLIDNIRKIQPYADVILDDGSHVEEHMVTSFRTLWSLVKPNGFYIIEDVRTSFFERIAKLNTECGFSDAKLIRKYNGKGFWDNFVVFQKI
jgi:Macrocin-O-methyltransferase (TylF)